MPTSASKRNHRSMKLAFAVIATMASILAVSAPAALAGAPIDPSTDPFYTTDEICKLTLSPSAIDVPVNGTQTITAKLESTGVPAWYGTGSVMDQEPSAPNACIDEVFSKNPKVLRQVAGFPVTFVASSGPNSPATVVVPLGEDYTASHTYSSSQVGTDIWHATIDLPEVCIVDWSQIYSGDDGSYYYDGLLVPEPCLGDLDGLDGCINDAGELDFDCDDQCYDEYCGDSSGVSAVTLTTPAAAITWVAPVVTQQTPSVSVSSSKKCHTANKFRIRPSASNGQVASMTLYVDGKRVRKVNGAVESFTINAAKYGPGSHTLKLVTSFTNGSTVTTTKTFSRCKARTVVKRTKPRFTG